MTTAARRIMRISQNSSAFCDVRCVISVCEQDRELQGVGAKHSRTPVSVARMVKVHAVPGDAEEAIFFPSGPTATFELDDNCFCLRHCVSAADQMQFFPDAPLLPNMRTQI